MSQLSEAALQSFSSCGLNDSRKRLTSNLALLFHSRRRRQGLKALNRQEKKKEEAKGTSFWSPLISEETVDSDIATKRPPPGLSDWKEKQAQTGKGVQSGFFFSHASISIYFVPQPILSRSLGTLCLFLETFFFAVVTMSGVNPCRMFSSNWHLFIVNQDARGVGSMRRKLMSR